MHILFEEHLDRLTEMHTQAAHILETVPQEALDWSPGGDIPTLAILAAHIAGSVEYWIADVAGQVDTHRDRDAEFTVQGQSAAVLKARLDAGFGASRRTMETLTLDDLTEMRPANRGRTVTVAWAILHALEHASVHVGNMEIIRSLWESQR
jgi:uncharacterized damage-inducible protein DinB